MTVFQAGDSVRLIRDGFGSEDDSTRARGLLAGQVYRVRAIVKDRKGVTWVQLHAVDAPLKKYPGWSPYRFELVRRSNQ